MPLSNLIPTKVFNTFSFFTFLPSTYISISLLYGIDVNNTLLSSLTSIVPLIVLLLILVIFNLIPVDIVKLFYKIIHSLIINIIYGESIYLIINKLPKKYTKISIN